MLELFANSAFTLLAGTAQPWAATPAPGTSESWQVVSSAPPLPQPSVGVSQYRAVISPVLLPDTNPEIVLVTAVGDGTHVTVTRGAEGSPVKAHLAGDQLTCILTAGNLASFASLINPTFTGHVTVPNGTATTDAASYGQVQALLAGISVAEFPAQAVSTTNVAALTGLPIIGTGSYQTANNDRVLLVGQTTSSQNGLWQLPPASGAWFRPPDFATGSNAAGKLVEVEDGSVWILPSLTPVTVDTTGQAWQRFDLGALTFTAPLVKTGTTVAIPPGTFAQGFTRTGPFTTNQTLAPAQYSTFDTTTGSLTATLPTAPADRSRIGVKMVAQDGPGAHTITVACGGSDHINLPTGPTSAVALKLLNQGIIYQYDTASATWTVQSDDLPLSQLDARYAQAGTSVQIPGHANESIPVSIAGSLADLAMPTSSFLARLAAGDVVAATVAQAKTLLALTEHDVANLTTDLATKVSLDPVAPTGVAATDTANLQAAINATPSGFICRPAPGAYVINATLTVTTPMVIDLTGVTITQTTTGLTGVAITSSNVAVLHGRIVGPQFTVYTGTEKAISAIAASAAAPLTNITFSEVDVSSWGGCGLWAQWVNNLTISRNNIHDIRHEGIVLLSCLRGHIVHNEIDNISGTSGENAWGILISRGSTTSLATDPRSADIIVAGNTINGVPGWEGIDTHSGLRITIIGNTVLGCQRGIVVTTTGTSPDFAPLQVDVIGNNIDSQVVDGSAHTGITFNGGGAAGVRTLAATGSIIGNTVIGCGDQSNANDGAISLFWTEGVVIATNTILAPSPAGIMLYHDNFDFLCTGNTIIDPFSNTVGVGEAAGIWAPSDYNIGQIGGNLSATSGAVAATYLLTRGIEVGNQTNNLVALGVNSSTSAIPLLDSGGKANSGALKLATTANVLKFGSNSQIYGSGAGQVFFRNAADTAYATLFCGGISMNGSFGHTGTTFGILGKAAATQGATPVTLADCIALFQRYGFCP